MRARARGWTQLEVPTVSCWSLLCCLMVCPARKHAAPLILTVRFICCFVIHSDCCSPVVARLIGSGKNRFGFLAGSCCPLMLSFAEVAAVLIMLEHPHLSAAMSPSFNIILFSLFSSLCSLLIAVILAGQVIILRFDWGEAFACLFSQSSESWNVLLSLTLIELLLTCPNLWGPCQFSYFAQW